MYISQRGRGFGQISLSTGGTQNTGAANPNNLPVQSGPTPICPIFQSPTTLTVTYGPSSGGEIDPQSATWFCSTDQGSQLIADIAQLPNTLLARAVPAYATWLDSQELGALIPMAAVSLGTWGLLLAFLMGWL